MCSQALAAMASRHDRLDRRPDAAFCVSRTWILARVVLDRDTQVGRGHADVRVSREWRTLPACDRRPTKANLVPA